MKYTIKSKAIARRNIVLRSIINISFINIFLYNESKMTKAVLIHETLNHIEEIDIDIEPSKNEIFKILLGRATFIGQWPEIDVVIMKPEHGLIENENVLPYPFHGDDVKGKVLLMRMDENSEPQDFTLREYTLLHPRDEGILI
jgi:hypothetical protein|tara:strand:- start:948 stop:1376 length:429 start_codon:yes stop_codon:yes gene_type:complete